MNTVTLATEKGLLQAILDEPSADDLRLIYADWFDEHAQPERAEFIHCQVELAKAPFCLGLRRSGHKRPCRNCRPFEALRRRERELLQHLTGESLGLSEYILSLTTRGEPVLFDRRGKEVCRPVLCRGFVDRVHLTVVNWCGGLCERCSGDGQAHGSDRPFEWSADVDYGKCVICRGTGRTDAHGPAFVRAAPLERVVLSDRKPLLVTGRRARGQDDRHVWSVAGSSGAFVRTEQGIGDEGNWSLPGPLYYLLDGGEPHERGIGYVTFDAALNALSAAALAWAKAQPAP
jgi:uncharacterized protein (TIGR02996 family)